MTTVFIDTSSEEARRIIEFLKSVKYAKVFEGRELNIETIDALVQDRNHICHDK